MISALTTHRYLLGQLVMRDVLLRYRGAMFGVLWIFLSPLLMLAIFAFVFGHIFQARWPQQPEGLPFWLMLYSGLDRIQPLRRGRVPLTDGRPRIPQLCQKDHLSGGDTSAGAARRRLVPCGLQSPHPGGGARLDRPSHRRDPALSHPLAAGAPARGRALVVPFGLGGLHQGHESDRTPVRSDDALSIACLLPGVRGSRRRCALSTTTTPWEPSSRPSGRPSSPTPSPGPPGSSRLRAAPSPPSSAMPSSGTAATSSPMPSDDIAISVRNLTKTYRLFGHPGDRIKQFLSLGLKRYHNEFTALKDVSFDIKKGETVGIIGRNGSGKSTLLQLICGILKPTSGTVTGERPGLRTTGTGGRIQPGIHRARERIFPGCADGSSEGADGATN